MAKTIILAVLVSLSICIATFSYFFDYDQFYLAVVVALAVGLLIIFLFRAGTTEPPVASKPLAIQLLAVGVGTIVILFGVSIFDEDDDECPGPITLQVHCGPTPSIQYGCANYNTDITWLLPAGFTVRIHDFERERWNGPIKENPLINDPPASTKEIKSKIKSELKKGKYKYWVTCIAEDGSWKNADPVIDVPKGGGGKY